MLSRVRVKQGQQTARPLPTKEPARKAPILNIYRQAKDKSLSKSKRDKSETRERSLTPSRVREKEKEKENQSLKQGRASTPSRTLGSNLYRTALVKAKPKVSPRRVTPTKEQQRSEYYIRRLTKALNNPYSREERDQLYREHFMGNHSLLQRYKDAKPAEDWTTKRCKEGGRPQRKCLVLDLDETLIHYVDSKQPFDQLIDIEYPDGTRDSAGINIRPHCKAFLEEMSKIYEVVVFTASQHDYARSILQHLDPKRELVSKLLSRECCVRTDRESYIKDLRILNRPLESTLIVDNSIVSYLGQPDNGVPIIPFYSSRQDDELLELAKFLTALAREQDVRKVIRSHFQFAVFSETKEAQEVFVKLYREG